MPQLHLYLPDDVADEVRRRAASRGLTVSRFLVEIVSREVSMGWPPGWFDRVVGGWKGELERPPQGVDAPRQEL